MNHDRILLDEMQRTIIEKTICDHCKFRGWNLHLYAVNVRSNHVHVVVTACDTSPEVVMSQLKAWCSRRLNEQSHANVPRKWWTPHGSTKWINDGGYLNNAINYVLHRQ